MDDSESRTEQPDIVSQWLEVDVPVVLVIPFVVVVTENMVEYVHAEAVLVSHSGFSSVVILLSLPMVIFGHGGNVPCSVNPGGHLIKLMGGGPGP